MVAAEEPGVPEQQEAGFGDTSHLHSLAVSVRGAPAAPDEAHHLF